MEHNTWEWNCIIITGSELGHLWGTIQLTSLFACLFTPSFTHLCMYVCIYVYIFWDRGPGRPWTCDLPASASPMLDYRCAPSLPALGDHFRNSVYCRSWESRWRFGILTVRSSSATKLPKETYVRLEMWIFMTFQEMTFALVDCMHSKKVPYPPMTPVMSCRILVIMVTSGAVLLLPLN
jgi:hypothetical protein